MRTVFSFIRLVSSGLLLMVTAVQGKSEAGEGHWYGALKPTLAHAAAGRESGWKVAPLAIHWDHFEPVQGQVDEGYVREMQAKITAFRQLGYKIMLDFGLHYPPKWIFELPQGRFRNQWGERFTTTADGKDVPNAVFSGPVRDRIDWYVGEVCKRMIAECDFVRLGGGKYGEVNYPTNRFGNQVNSYWAFDDFAQGRAPGLPTGMRPCPVPGWIPGTSTPSHTAARAFADWYLSSLQNYHDWQIKNVRRWFAGDICILYGSRGLRPGRVEMAVEGDLAGATLDERVGEIQQGYDWARMIGGIRDPKAIVYCTWIDGTLRNRDETDDASADPSRWSPVHWQASLARANPLRLRVWGENTGHNTSQVLALTFDRIQTYGLMGVMWAFESELFAKPNPQNFASFHDYAAMIRANP